MKTKFSQFIVDNAPGILTGVGILTMVATTVEAVRVTPKAMMLIENRKGELEVDDLQPTEIIKTTWKTYMPSLMLGVTSMACFLVASGIQSKRNALLATAYALSETALREYTTKVIETVGEKKEQEIRDAISKKRLAENPVSENTVVVTGNDSNTMFYDPLSGRYFMSDIEKIKKAVNNINRELNLERYVSLNDFYSEIQLKSIEIGQDLGWNIDKGLLDIYLSAQLNEECKPCVVINHRVPPFYGYDRLI